MKHDSDTEMDLLLRRHGRRGGSSVTGAEGDDDARAKPDAMRASATHLDADELSAYAEGALPERARSRYAAHLTDCDACRRLVTELVISSGIEAEEGGRVAQTVIAPRRFWGEWFGSLFSPPVLRYAIPALALFAVIAVVLVVATRKRDEPSFVAMNKPSQGQSANTSLEDQKNGAAPTTATTESAENHGDAATATANTDAAKPGAASPPSLQKETNTTTPQQDGVAPATKSAEAPVTEAQPSTAQPRESEDRKNTSPFLSNSPTDTNKNPAKEKDDEALADKNRQESKQQASGGAPATAAGPVNGRVSRGEETSGNSVEFGAGAATGERKKNESAKSAPAPAARTRRDSAGNDEVSSETRSVAGKSFRRQNSVWVDTTYNSSRSPLKVKRGSEQYRALVADEPVIATVSNELGNVIVVVSGRAYHIY